MKKRFLSTILVLCMVLLPATVQAIDESELEARDARTTLLEMPAVSSGNLDYDLKWKLVPDGLGFNLIISGTGPMRRGSPPWKKYEDLILEIIIEEGVTTICSIYSWTIAQPV